MNDHTYIIETLFAWGQYQKGHRIPMAPPNFAHELVRNNRARIIGENGVLYPTTELRAADVVRRGPGRPRTRAL